VEHHSWRGTDVERWKSQVFILIAQAWQAIDLTIFGLRRSLAIHLSLFMMGGTVYAFSAHFYQLAYRDNRQDSP